MSAFIGASIGYICALNSVVLPERSPDGFHIIGWVLGGAIFGNFMYGYFVGIFRFAYSSRLRRIEVELAKAGSVELQDTIEENFFTKLVQINFKYLDQYYLQTQEQADKSFRLSAFAAISGLIA